MAVTYSGDAATTRTNLGLGSLATKSAVGAAEITDNSVGAAELNVSGNGTSGQLLASDGDGSFSWSTVSGGGDYAMVVFTSPGTWTKDAGLKAIKVTVVGGGGNSGAVLDGAVCSTGGGGGGGAAIKYIPAPSIPGPVSVTRGAAAGTSSFGAFCSATGGSPSPNVGPGNKGGNGGAGGVGSSGDLNIAGSGGVFGSTDPDSSYAYRPRAQGGAGGSSILGGGAVGRGATSPDSSLTGNPGGAYGGGAGGASRDWYGSYTGGGTGASGVVIVEEFY